jgi:hypothetical protein
MIDAYFYFAVLATGGERCSWKSCAEDCAELHATTVRLPAHLSIHQLLFFIPLLAEKAAAAFSCLKFA